MVETKKCGQKIKYNIVWIYEYNTYICGMNCKRILKKHGLTTDVLATMFGYKNSDSFRNSSGYKRYVNGVCLLAEKIEASIIENIKK